MIRDWVYVFVADPNLNLLTHKIKKNNLWKLTFLLKVTFKIIHVNDCFFPICQVKSLMTENANLIDMLTCFYHIDPIWLFTENHTVQLSCFILLWLHKLTAKQNLLIFKYFYEIRS